MTFLRATTWVELPSHGDVTHRSVPTTEAIGRYGHAPERGSAVADSPTGA